jgi:hypothetical protein
VTTVSPLPHDYEVDPGPAGARRTVGLVLTSILAVVLAVLALVFVRATSAAGGGLTGTPLPIVGLVLGTALFALVAYLASITFLAVPRMRFHVGARRFEIRTLFGTRVFHTDGLRATRYVPRFELRLMGTAMAGYYTGWFLIDGQRTLVYATGRGEGVLLEDASTRVFVTPANVSGMLESLRLAGVKVEEGGREHAEAAAKTGSPGARSRGRRTGMWIVLGLVLLAPLVAVLGFLLLPRFKRTGALSVSGATFEPTSCHVLTREVGVELADDRGGRLAVFLPAARSAPLAFTTIEGASRARLTTPDGVTELGACGTLRLRGEAYHASGKRAMGGHVSLACEPGGAGEVEFEGCF